MGNKTPHFSSSDNPAANSDSFLTRILTFLYLPAFNFWLLLCPVTLSFDWSMDTIPLLQSIFDWRNVFSVIFYSSMLSLGIMAFTKVNTANFCEMFIELNANYKKYGHDNIHHGTMNGTNGVRKRTINRSKQTTQMTQKEPKYQDTKHRVPGDETYTLHHPQSFLVSMAILVLPFVPASNLFFYVGFVVAERVLYIPSVGFCIMVSIGVDLLMRYCNSSVRKLVYGCVCGMVVLFAMKTIHRNMDWKDGETLYRSVKQRNIIVVVKSNPGYSGAAGESCS